MTTTKPTMQTMIDYLNTPDMLNPATAKKYIACLKATQKLLALKDNKIHTAFEKKNIDSTVDKLFEKYPNSSTRKGYLAMLLKITKRYFGKDYDKIEMLTAKTRDESVATKLIVHARNQDTINMAPYKDAVDMMADFKISYDLALSRMDPRKPYDLYRQSACYLYLVLKHGQLRVDELMSIHVRANNDANINHINKGTKEMVIYEHKTMKRDGTKRTKLSDEFINLFGTYEGPLICNTQGNTYATSSGAKKHIEKNITDKVAIYDIRKAKVSLAMRAYEQSTKPSLSELEALSKYHGHTIGIMMQHYDKYSLEKPTPKQTAGDDNTRAEENKDLIHGLAGMADLDLEDY